MPKPTRCPFTIVVDARQQRPFSFETITTGSDFTPVVITTETAGLKQSDYSIRGLESLVAVERKSVADLYQTLTVGRDRFERELDRLADLNFSAVVVEGGWSDITSPAPFASKVNPNSIVGSVFAMMQRYPRTHWVICDTRESAERATYAILRRYWLDNIEGAAESWKQRATQVLVTTSAETGSYTPH